MDMDQFNTMVDRTEPTGLRINFLSDQFPLVVSSATGVTTLLVSDQTTSF